MYVPILRCCNFSIMFFQNSNLFLFAHSFYAISIFLSASIYILFIFLSTGYDAIAFAVAGYLVCWISEFCVYFFVFCLCPLYSKICLVSLPLFIKSSTFFHQKTSISFFFYFYVHILIVLLHNPIFFLIFYLLFYLVSSIWL